METNYFKYKDLEITPSTEDENIYYFSDEFNSYYYTINLEDTDGFLSFMDWINETYDVIIYDEIDKYFTDIFEANI